MSPAVRRVVSGVSWLSLPIWAAWFVVGAVKFKLPLAERTWFVNPAFGADFWSQPDYASRMWIAGFDPYEPTKHLFHYPPIVIRMFLWTPYLTMPTALRIWIALLTATIVYAVVLAWRERTARAPTELPLVTAVALVLYSFPVVFQLERANFDLITLMALVIAVPLMSRAMKDPNPRKALAADLGAGALLAFGPWVKIYPGFLGPGLAALRKWRVIGSFVVVGALIFAIMPQETLRSFQVLKEAIRRTNEAAKAYPFGTWSHSLSSLWYGFVESHHRAGIWRLLHKINASGVAVTFTLPLLGWVSWRVFRSPRRQEVAFSYLLWVVSVATFVPQIANDYSLVFLPIAAVGVFRRGESRLTHALFVLGLPWLQPFAFPVSGSVLLISKVCTLVAVGISVARTAKSLETGDAAPAQA